MMVVMIYDSYFSAENGMLMKRPLVMMSV